jgi:hypothetical protein
VTVARKPVIRFQKTMTLARIRLIVIAETAAGQFKKILHTARSAAKPFEPDPV